jgi:5-methylcytosine-specific restriction endonuclease McrA
MRANKPRLKLDPEEYRALRHEILERDSWRCQVCGSSSDLQVHHLKYRSKLGNDEADNLIVLCVRCHHQQHGN